MLHFQFPRLEVNGCLNWFFGSMPEIKSVLNTSLIYLNVFYDIKRVSRYFSRLVIPASYSHFNRKGKQGLSLPGLKHVRFVQNYNLGYKIFFK